MKKIIITLCLFTFSFAVFSQTCEQREARLLDAIGGFSAGMLYNTYGIIGAISDGFVHDAYDQTTTNDLMDSQKKVIDNMVKVLDELNKDNMLKDPDDKDFANKAIAIFKGLRRQAQFLQDYTGNKSSENQKVYDDQRKENWAAISKLMGLKEN